MRQDEHVLSSLHKRNCAQSECWVEHRRQDVIVVVVVVIVVIVVKVVVSKVAYILDEF